MRSQAVASAVPSDVFPTVGAQDVVPLGEEASPHQGQGALLAVKAVVMPLPFLKGDVFCATQACEQRRQHEVKEGRECELVRTST